MARGHDSRKTGQREKFLDTLRKTANVSEAARVSGLNYKAVYVMRKNDETFRAQWEEALQEAIDTLEGEAYRRACIGYDEYVTCKDGLVYGEDGKPVMQRRYSDGLMTTLLKAHKPDKYRDRSSVDLNVTENITQAIAEGRERAKKAVE